ncbi:MAG: hypothetical protein JWP93_212 [Polaromonas sp.]|jgi:hypothetical protein|nr:hypothetical protein [Polaromonas sp.]
MAYFDATDDFDATLSEIDFLAACAKNSKTNTHDYLAYLKAAFVLLGAKFEAFSENIVEDYVSQLAMLAPKAKHLNRELRIHSTTHRLTQCVSNAAFSAKTMSIKNLQAAASLWDEDCLHQELHISNKFNYGKHGSEELKNLFKRIGFQDILTECQITLRLANTMLSTAHSRTSISADIDSLTNIRNNIIHSDASPSNITHQQLIGYKENIWEFGFLVDMRLDKELQSIKTLIRDNP